MEILEILESLLGFSKIPDFTGLLMNALEQSICVEICYVDFVLHIVSDNSSNNILLPGAFYLKFFMEAKNKIATRGRSQSSTPLVLGGHGNGENFDEAIDIDLQSNIDEGSFFPKMSSYFKLSGSGDDIEEPPVDETEPGVPAGETNVFLHKLFTYARYTISSCLTLSYVCYLLWGIWTDQAVLPGPPVAHFFIFVFCLVLIAYLEGLQIAILALEKESPEKKRFSHPRAYKLIMSVKEGNNVERFLVGRQFFTIFIMTLMAQVTSFPLVSNLGIPEIIWFVLVQTGLPGAVVVTTIGSLHSQLLSAKDPWQFMDMYGSYSVLQLCYGSEVTGICTHFAWLLIGLFRRTVYITDKPPKARKVLGCVGESCEVFKYLLSTAVVLSYAAYIMFGIWTNQAILPLPEIGVFFTLLFCLICLSLLEGLQVAILVTENTDPESFRISHPRAYQLMKRVTFEKNVRRFLIGRQFFVIFIVFLINQCTIFPDMPHSGINNIVWLLLVQLGLPTALTVLCFSQLPAQLLANQDPLLFMSRYGACLTLEICLFTEKTGLAHFSWVVTSLSKATWFSITATKLDEIGQYKDLEMHQRGPLRQAGAGTETDVAVRDIKTGPHFNDSRSRDKSSCSSTSGTMTNFSSRSTSAAGTSSELLDSDDASAPAVDKDHDIDNNSV